MRIQELIDQLEKVKYEYPDHDIQIRGTNWIAERVEINNKGVEIVPIRAPLEPR